jgi:hypothetical protein
MSSILAEIKFFRFFIFFVFPSFFLPLSLTFFLGGGGGSDITKILFYFILEPIVDSVYFSFEFIRDVR